MHYKTTVKVQYNKVNAIEPVSDKIIDMAHRIVYACEVDGACPCDSDICEF